MAAIIFHTARFISNAATWSRRQHRSKLLCATIPRAPKRHTASEACISTSRRRLTLEQCFEHALTLHASYPDTLANSWNNLGLLSARGGRPVEAVGYFQKALQLSPDHLIALINLGSAYRQTKRWDDARKIYEHALAVNPNDADANYGIGMVYAQNENSDEAFNSLQRALTLRPAYPEALNNLGILYLRTQRRDQAVASFEECIRVAPSFDQAYLNLARIYAIEGTAEKARAVLLALLQQHPDHPLALQMMKQIQP